MAQIFTNREAVNLLKGKFVLFIGDSNMRALYKDFIFLIKNNAIIPAQHLKRIPSNRKYESYLGDRVVSHSNNNVNGREYYEVRDFKERSVHLRFHYVTKVNGGAFKGRDIRDSITGIERKEIPIPDIIIMNSGMWDLTRFGPTKEDEYKRDLVDVFGKFRQVLPDETLILWTSILPTSVKYTKGGFLVQQLEFIRYSLRFMVMEANMFAHQLCMMFGIDFIDLHYHMRFQLHRRAIDGIHWEPHAVRFMTCLLLTHMSLALDVALPRRVQNNYLSRTIEKSVDIEDENIHKVQGEVLNRFENDIKKYIERELSKMSSKSRSFSKSVNENSKQNPSEPKDVSQAATKQEDRVKLSARRRFQPVEAPGPDEPIAKTCEEAKSVPSTKGKPIANICKTAQSVSSTKEKNIEVKLNARRRFQSFEAPKPAVPIANLFKNPSMNIMENQFGSFNGNMFPPNQNQFVSFNGNMFPPNQNRFGSFNGNMFLPNQQIGFGDSSNWNLQIHFNSNNQQNGMWNFDGSSNSNFGMYSHLGNMFSQIPIETINSNFGHQAYSYAEIERDFVNNVQYFIRSTNSAFVGLSPSTSNSQNNIYPMRNSYNNFNVFDKY